MTRDDAVAAAIREALDRVADGDWHAVWRAAAAKTEPFEPEQRNPRIGRLAWLGVAGVSLMLVIGIGFASIRTRSDHGWVDVREGPGAAPPVMLRERGTDELGTQLDFTAAGGDHLAVVLEPSAAALGSLTGGAETNGPTCTVWRGSVTGGDADVHAMAWRTSEGPSVVFVGNSAAIDIAQRDIPALVDALGRAGTESEAMLRIEAALAPEFAFETSGPEVLTLSRGSGWANRAVLGRETSFVDIRAYPRTVDPTNWLIGPASQPVTFAGYPGRRTTLGGVTTVIVPVYDVTLRIDLVGIDERTAETLVEPLLTDDPLAAIDALPEPTSAATAVEAALPAVSLPTC